MVFLEDQLREREQTISELQRMLNKTKKEVQTETILDGNSIQELLDKREEKYGLHNQFNERMREAIVPILQALEVKKIPYDSEDALRNLRSVSLSLKEQLEGFFYCQFFFDKSVSNRKVEAMQSEMKIQEMRLDQSLEFQNSKKGGKILEKFRN